MQLISFYSLSHFARKSREEKEEEEEENQVKFSSVSQDIIVSIFPPLKHSEVSLEQCHKRHKINYDSQEKEKVI